MLLIVAAIILVCWLTGTVFSIGGSLIHALVVLAVILVVAHFVMGQREP